MTKVFIDGASGTTGLRIYDRLAERKDIELISLSDDLRKDIEARKNALNTADIVFLCLPDDAAREAVSMINNEHTAVIDTSTAHRTNENWVYGFSELMGTELVRNSKRIANPGCHASGFLALIKPLVDNAIIPKDLALTCFSLTGYSGGGKQKIAEYETTNDQLLFSPRQYGLTQNHKHLKEMTIIAGLNVQPIFCPVIDDFYSGMEVSVPLFKKDINGTVADIKQIYKDTYKGRIVHYDEAVDESGYLSAVKLCGRDDMEVSVFGNEERIVLVSRFDNLGKGASGSAIQNMNILLGCDETQGLVLGDC